MAEPGKLLFVTPKSERKLRQLVGAPNTTDYGSDGTADTPQQNINRKDTNTATAEVTTDYQGMLHLSIETEIVDDEEVQYLTVDWPESNAVDETLVGIYRNKEIHYTEKSIQLTEDINIYVDVYRLKIIAANPNRQTIGSYWKLIGQYKKDAGSVSQLWREDRANDGALYSGYTGMLHVFLDVEVTTDSSGNVISETLYLNVDWPESGSRDQTLVGNFNNRAIYWYARQAVPEGGGMIAFDPHTREILMVKAGDVFVSNWKTIATYNATTKSVNQSWRNDRPGSGLLFDGYDGNFVMAYDRGSGTIQILPSIYGLNTVIGTTIAGGVSVNNFNYSVPSYSGVATNDTYFYIRHRVAQSAFSGDEDPDLSEDQKQALRTQIANCDTAISTANQAINQYLQQITALQTQRTAAYNAISTANSTYNSGVSTENNRHTSAVNAENADYNQKVSAEDTLNNNNLATLQSTYYAGVASENTTHVNNLNNLDPTASDYDQKVAAENARHAQVLENLLNTYNTGVTAENTRHNAKRLELLTAHNAVINAENSTHSTNLNTLSTTRDTAVSAQWTIINGLDSQIATLRSNITAQQQIIMNQTNTKNAACLQLYGVIPASGGCEIVTLPSTAPAAQTDQYLYIYLGSVQRSTRSVQGVSTDYININQAYQGSMMAFYRISNSCKEELQ